MGAHSGRANKAIARRSPTLSAMAHGVQRAQLPETSPAGQVQRMIRRQQAVGNARLGRMGEAPLRVQPKLMVAPANDRYEQEADRTADRVMRMPDKPCCPACARGAACAEHSKTEEVGFPLRRQPSQGEEQLHWQADDTADLQRQPAEDEQTLQRQVEDAETLQRQHNNEETLQRQPTEDEPTIARQPEDETALATKAIHRMPAGNAAGMEVPPELEPKVRRLQQGGEPLPKDVRAKFEPKFGADFSNVRIHRDAAAAETASALKAKAYTSGEHISFAAGQYAPGTSAGDRLMAHELTHVGQHSDRMRARLSRAPKIHRRNTEAAGSSNVKAEEEKEADRAAAAIRNAFEGIGTDDQTLWRELNKPPKQLRRVFELYNRKYNTHTGKGLIEDLKDEQSGRDLEFSFSLLRRSGLLQDKQAPRFQGLDLTNQFIWAEPALQIAVPGTKITYSVRHKHGTYSSPQSYYSYQWYVMNDPATSRARGAPARFQGPSSGTWKNAEWDFPGTHEVLCRVQFHPAGGTSERPIFLRYKQKVVPIKERADEAFKEAFEGPASRPALQAGVYLALLEIQLEKARKDKSKRSAERVRKLERAVTNAREKLKLPGGKTAAEDLERILPVRGILVPTVRPEPVRLNLYLRPMSGHQWEFALIDVTDPSPEGARVYKGTSQAPGGALPAQHAKKGAQIARLSIEKAWDEFIEENEHPQGQLTVEFPAKVETLFGVTPRRRSQHNDGESRYDAVAKWFSRVGLVAGLGAIALTVLPVPGSRVVAGLILISAGAGVAATGLRIADRLEHGNFTWGRETAFDLLDLAGSLPVGAGASLRLSGYTIGRFGSAILITEGIDTGTDVASGLILSALHWRRIEEIRNSNLPESEKKAKIAGILKEASAKGGMLLLGMVGAAGGGRKKTGGSKALSKADPEVKLGSTTLGVASKLPKVQKVNFLENAKTTVSLGLRQVDLDKIAQDFLRTLPKKARKRFMRNDTAAIGLVQDSDGHQHLVYTIAGNRTSPSIRETAESLGLTRWVAEPRAGKRGPAGAPADAEQLLIEAQLVNREFELLGASATRKYCLDCEFATTDLTW